MTDVEQVASVRWVREDGTVLVQLDYNTRLGWALDNHTHSLLRQAGRGVLIQRREAGSADWSRPTLWSGAR